MEIHAELLLFFRKKLITLNELHVAENVPSFVKKGAYCKESLRYTKQC
jgi:hypothetical protein